MATALASYRLRSGRLHDVTGPLALLAAQAITAAQAGREAVISDSDGNTVAVTTDDRGRSFTVVAVGPIQLLPLTATETSPPVWATRLAVLINNIQGDTP